MDSGLKIAKDDGDEPVLENVLHIIVGGKNILVRSSEIKEVVRPLALTTVPMGPGHLMGLSNIHGQIVCIIDIGGVTTLPSCSRVQTSRTRFLLLRHASMHVGIWVDEVCSIRQLDKDLLPVSEPEGGRMTQVNIEGVSYDLLSCSSLLD